MSLTAQCMDPNLVGPVLNVVAGCNRLLTWRVMQASGRTIGEMKSMANYRAKRVISSIAEEQGLDDQASTSRPLDERAVQWCLKALKHRRQDELAGKLSAFYGI